MSEPIRTEPTHSFDSHDTKRRARRLPATGMPVNGEGRRTSSLVSLLIHILIILLIAMPIATHTGDVKEMLQGAGGPGPAGGGGGGHNGSGGQREHVQYVAVRPPPAPAPKPAVVIPPPVTPPPKPVIPPLQVKPPEPEVTPQPVKLDIKVAEAKIPDAAAPTIGTGGGTGRDGTNGSGPGSGGGVGSGIGTGKGSGVGPGTGGGVQANYPPSTTELFLPPLPYPDKVRGFHLVAEFDVDSTGKVLNYTFTPTRDG
ncbi:MAG TPA: hypothetical protein VH277_00385, partial [Gemmatimonadaceae bacterium]|nr:hypothetical protein [Gemmatimonadaceae bacterium]